MLNENVNYKILLKTLTSTEVRVFSISDLIFRQLLITNNVNNNCPAHHILFRICLELMVSITK